MDRRSFLSALAGAAAGRFFCPTGAHAASQAPHVTAHAPVARSILTPEWVGRDALRLLARRLDHLGVDRYAAPPQPLHPVKLGDTILLRAPARFEPFNVQILDTEIPVTLETESMAETMIVDQDLRLPANVFAERYLKPAMNGLAECISIATRKGRHGKDLLVSGPVPLAYVDGAVLWHGEGLNLRLCWHLYKKGDLRVRFDVLHGVAHL